MDANQLFFYLRGFTELNQLNPTAEQWAHMRSEILRAKPVEPPVEMVNPIPGKPPTGCGCK